MGHEYGEIIEVVEKLGKEVCRGMTDEELRLVSGGIISPKKVVLPLMIAAGMSMGGAPVAMAKPGSEGPTTATAAQERPAGPTADSYNEARPAPSGETEEGRGAVVREPAPGKAAAPAARPATQGGGPAVVATPKTAGLIGRFLNGRWPKPTPAPLGVPNEATTVPVLPPKPAAPTAESVHGERGRETAQDQAEARRRLWGETEGDGNPKGGPRDRGGPAGNGRYDDDEAGAGVRRGSGRQAQSDFSKIEAMLRMVMQEELGKDLVSLGGRMDKGFTDMRGQFVQVGEQVAAVGETLEEVKTDTSAIRNDVTLLREEHAAAAETMGGKIEAIHAMVVGAPNIGNALKVILTVAGALGGRSAWTTFAKSRQLTSPECLAGVAAACALGARKLGASGLVGSAIGGGAALAASKSSAVRSAAKTVKTMSKPVVQRVAPVGQRAIGAIMPSNFMAQAIIKRLGIPAALVSAMLALRNTTMADLRHLAFGDKS